MTNHQESVEVSYRESHKAAGKGKEYHDIFQSNGLLYAMWQLEQDALSNIVDQEYLGSVENYLDFACGTARVTTFMSGLVKHANGVDISAEMLSQARQNAPGVNFLHGDITSDPTVLGDRVFDLITAFRFFPNAEPALRNQVMSVLVDRLSVGGLLVFNNHLNDSSLRHKLFFKLKRKLFGTLLGEGVSHSMTIDEVEQLAGSHGLEIVRRYPIGHLPMTEKVYLYPRGPLIAIERFLAKHVGSERSAQYVLYACRRKP
ncbi:MAG: class I SAM-dependent methyltransferase [Gammaproteobacteria bacterium]|nr:class I SAM-dependent methyltransferase [Gammaproteobacteria bacterium]